MNQNEVTSAAQGAKRAAETLITTLVDVGSMWAVQGLKIGKMALSTSAETLGKTAHALDTIAVEIEKKRATPAEAAPAPAPEGAKENAPAESAPAESAPAETASQKN